MSDLRFLLQLAGVRHRDIAMAVATATITLLAALSLTVLSGWLITRASQMPPILALSVAITAVRALGISRAVFRYIDRLVSHQLGLQALTTLRARIYDALAAGSPVTRGEGHSQLVTDTERVTDYIVRGIVPRGAALVLSLVVLCFTFWLHPWAGVIMAIALSITGFLLPRLALYSHRRAHTARASEDFGLRLDELLQHRAEFQAAGLADAQLQQAAHSSITATRAHIAAQNSLAWADATQAWATGASTLLVAICGVNFYQADPTWLGMLIMIPLAAFESHAPLPGAATCTFDAKLAAQRLRAIALNPAAASDFRVSPTSPSTPTRLLEEPLDNSVVDVRCLHTQYTASEWTFRLAPGERLLIQGPSGMGKTLLLETLAGLREPSAGTFSAPPTTRFFASDAWIFATTVRENLRVAAPLIDDDTAAAVLAAVGFHYPLDFLLNNGAESLSSGQCRRLLLARALCTDADVLLLDEPTAHMSRENAEAMLNMLLHSPLPGPKPLRTVIVVSHDETSG